MDTGDNQGCADGGISLENWMSFLVSKHRRKGSGKKGNKWLVNLLQTLGTNVEEKAKSGDSLKPEALKKTGAEELAKGLLAPGGVVERIGLLLSSADSLWDRRAREIGEGQQNNCVNGEGRVRGEGGAWASEPKPDV